MSIPRRGMTAIEVLASTLLAAMLMTALLGVLRGLKVQARALETVADRQAWRQSLDAVLAADLASASTYLPTPTSLTLKGYGGNNPNGTPNWLPSTVQYAVIKQGKSTWLIRRHATGDASLGAANLVLSDVQEIKVGLSRLVESDRNGAALPVTQLAPLPRELRVEFWGREPRELIYSLTRHAP